MVDGEGWKSEDVDQRLILSVPALCKAFSTATQRLRRITLDGAGVEFMGSENSHEVIDMLHAELHNVGHFVGNWPFSLAEKYLRSYEPIEEVRACLQSINLAQLAGLSKKTVQAIAQRVVWGRVLGYGMAAFRSNDRSWQTIREIASSVFLGEELFRRGTLQWTGTTQDHLCVHQEKLVPTLLEILNEIEHDELKNRYRGMDGLKSMSRTRLSRAFPKRDLPTNIGLLYSSHFCD